MTSSTEVVRICYALQMAMIDADTDRANLLLGELDAGQLRDVARELTITWLEVIFVSGLGAGLRDALAADALQAAIDDRGRR